MEELHQVLNEQIIKELKRKESLEYDSPANPDQHDDDLSVVKKRIEILIKLRAEIEDGLL